MNICRLKPEFVEPLSLALFEEWHDFAPWSSLDKIRAYYAQCLNEDDLPLAFAAVDKEGRLMGSAALKRFDMACFPEYEYLAGRCVRFAAISRFGRGQAAGFVLPG